MGFDSKRPLTLLECRFYATQPALHFLSSSISHHSLFTLQKSPSRTNQFDFCHFSESLKLFSYRYWLCFLDFIAVSIFCNSFRKSSIFASHIWIVYHKFWNIFVWANHVWGIVAFQTTLQDRRSRRILKHDFVWSRTSKNFSSNDPVNVNSINHLFKVTTLDTLINITNLWSKNQLCPICSFWMECQNFLPN